MPGKDIKAGRGTCVWRGYFSRSKCRCFSGVKEACRQFIQEDQLTETDIQQEKIYQHYHQIYQKIYEALKDSLYELAFCE